MNTSESGSKPKRIRKVARRRIKPISDRQTAKLREYAKVKRMWRKMLKLWRNWHCERCGGVPDNSPHHRRGRSGSLLCDMMHWVCICRKCHDWIHNNPAIARREGWLCAVGEWNQPPKDK